VDFVDVGLYVILSSEYVVVSGCACYVVSVGGQGAAWVSGSGNVRCVDVEQCRREDSSLGDTCVDIAVWRFGALEDGASLSAFDVVCKEFLYCGGDVGVMDFGDKGMDVDCVEGFTHVKGYHYGSGWGFVLVEALTDRVVDLVQSSVCGVIAFEAMLVSDVGNVMCDEGEDDALEKFGYWREKGDWSVGGT